MPIEYMYITNNPALARICEDAGVDRIFVDMEWRGKAERQKGMDSVKSHHTPADVANVRRVLRRARLLVRVNPAWDGTREEVEGALTGGADMLMLPMARNLRDAHCFLDAVNGRATTVLLLETIDAERNLESLLKAGFDEVHIGLNDLSLERGLPFMFSLLADGTVEQLCARLRKRGIPYGFGGVARLEGGRLPSGNILMEHVRLGSSRAILSRSFFNAAQMKDIAEAQAVFPREVARLRRAEADFRKMPAAVLEANRRRIKELCA
ncbi:MAG: aldolase [Desulfovibrio desulfuricans]|nr:aldolase [Desulfovibrio desulfuricans]